ncbi:ANTAR domain-containing protein [Actinopolymorpha pittospori]|uniref:Transcriptional regulator with GAF, ATPase, and Fis domain n=1 Tax=Actinopolymorpha pittospori TaxID=648752 RepID=A0A927REY8_9ACTN|nr:transcriptional regulator with GAF, ATPase, and Fis domain [Actinopolymorpha pittospori]
MRTVTERQLTEAFVELADTLADDFDVDDFLSVLTRHCTELLDAAAVGVVLTDLHGQLRVAASSSEQARTVELAALRSGDGPSLECFQASRVVTAGDIDAALERWPRFGPQAIAAGYRSVQALPLRLRTDVIGALTLFGATTTTLDEDALRLAQSLADVATIGLLQVRSIRQAEVLAEQLQSALDSRVVIEQAKGVLAERGGIAVDEAFTVLRGYARRNRLRLAELARQIVDGAVDTAPLLTGAGRTGAPR